MSKRPSFQFYPSDWLRDTALRTCSEGARGVWMDMLCYMHEGSPYGYLKVNGKVILNQTLSRMVGCPEGTLEGYLSELISAGVVQIDEEGCFYSKRMVKDEKVRQARAAGGKKGGNPALLGDKDKPKDNLADNQESATDDKQKPTPSSSSSSSSSDIKDSSTRNVERCPVQEIINLYNSTVNHLPVSRVQSESMKRSISARWKQDEKFQNLDFWRELFEYCEQNKFLSGRQEGRNGQQPFRASLEWIVNATNFAKIVNLNYDRDSQTAAA